MLHNLVQKLPWYKKLEVLRVVKDWTQEQAAEACGTNQKVYWNWEKGHKYPRNSSRRCISMGFGVPQEVIFGEGEVKS